MASPGVTEELLALGVRPPDQPVPEAGVEQHDGVVPPGDEGPGQGLEGEEELLPGLGLLHVEAGHGVVELGQGEGAETGQTDGEDVRDLLETINILILLLILILILVDR